MESRSVDRVVKRALLVGIDNYRCHPLQGCENDVNLLKDILPEFGFLKEDIHVLLNERATREVIVSQLKQFAKCTRVGDVFLFHFSGHGSEIQNRKKHNGWNETIVPYDGAGRQDIKDDEMQEFLAAFKSNNVIMIFDSCHSGDITREGYARAGSGKDQTVRGVPPPDGQLDEIVKTATERGVQYRNSRPSVFGGGWVKPANFVVLSACRDRQTAQECKFGEKYNGILTHHLCKILNVSATFQNRSWRDVHLELLTARSGGFREQTPQLEGLRDWRIFGTEPSPMMRHVALDILPGRKGVLCAGFLHGISPQSQWAIYPIGTHSDVGESPLEITGLTAPLGPIRAELAGTLPNLPSSGGFIAKCHSHIFKTTTKVMISNELDHKIAESIKHQIQSSETLELLPCNEETEHRWDYKIELKNNILSLKTSNGDSLAVLDVPRHEWQLFLSNLGKIVWHYGMLTAKVRPQDYGLTEKDTDIKIVTLSENDYSPMTWNISPQITMQDGELFYFQIKNRSKAPLNLTVIEFRCGYGIRVVYPPPGGDAAPFPPNKKPKNILANADATTVQRMEIPPGSYRRSNGDAEQFYRIIFTQHPSDFTFMEQESIVFLNRERSQDNFEERETSRGEVEKDGKEAKLQKQFTENPDIYFVRDIQISIKPSRKSEAYKNALACCSQWTANTVDSATFANMREELLKMPLNFVSSHQFESCFTAPNQEPLITEAQDDYVLTIVFFHGLMGGPSQSWPASTGEVWPVRWLLTHKNLKHKLRIICLSYQGNSKKPDLDTVTEDARKQISNLALNFEKPTVLVSEGSGAFILMKLLETEEKLVKTTIGVALYGLPFEIRKPLDVLLTIFEWTHIDTADIFAMFQEKYVSLVRRFVDQFSSLPVLLVQPRDSCVSDHFQKGLMKLKIFRVETDSITLMDVPSMDDFVIKELVSFLNNKVDEHNAASKGISGEPKPPKFELKRVCSSNQGCD